MMSKENLFDNTRTAFYLKSDSELERAHFLFKMISSEPLVKIGSVVTNFALSVNLPIEGLIKASVFDHFCGGVNQEDCMPVIDKIFTKKVCSVLDYSIEGKEKEEVFDAVMQKTIELIEFADHKEAMPFGVFKPTGLGRVAIWEKKSKGEEFTINEDEEWLRIVNRFDSICKKALECDVVLLIDAEEYNIQDAADELITKMMRKYNVEKAIVFNTLQFYRHDRMEYLKKIHEEARVYGYKVGVKLVRGAYMEKENELADEENRISPICKDKQTTDQNFDDALHYILKFVDDIAVFIGSHNESSCYKAMTIMKENKIAKDDFRVWFGQLFGMSDHISFNLAAEGYNVAKYIPFGPVKDVLPYLIRRADENTSVMGQTSRELKLLSKEKKRRKL